MSGSEVYNAAKINAKTPGNLLELMLKNPCKTLEKGYCFFIGHPRYSLLSLKKGLVYPLLPFVTCECHYDGLSYKLSGQK